MCGLFGVASSERRRNDGKRKDAFIQGLQSAEWRGMDATGIAWVPHSKIKEPAGFFKRAERASDFIFDERFLKRIRNIDEYAFVLGHARASTVDAYTVAHNNAHPFQVGPVTLVHNGTIRNYHSIDSGIQHPVDSAHVCGAMSDADPKTVLEKLEGGFALVWHDARDGSLNFARNNEKPLWFAFVKGENTMFWGSELETMYAVLFRNGIELDGKFKHCTAMSWYKFSDPNNLRGYERTPFVVRPSHSQIHHGMSVIGMPWQGETRRIPPETSSQSGTTAASTTTQDVGSTNSIQGTQDGGTESTSTTSTEDEPKVLDNKDSSRPRNRRKLRTVQQRLKDIGRRLDGLIMFVPESFESYKNQRNNLGKVRGRDKVKKQLFEIRNVKKTLWDKLNEHGKVYGRMVNVSLPQRKGGEPIIVCDYDEALQNRFVFKPHMAAGFSKEVPAIGKPFPESVCGEQSANALPGTDAVPLFKGPCDRLLSETQFKLAVRLGCCWCNDPLQLKDHNKILWVGASQQPLCPACSSNPGVISDLGVYSTIYGVV